VFLKLPSPDPRFLFATHIHPTIKKHISPLWYRTGSCETGTLIILIKKEEISDLGQNPEEQKGLL
jgi:hypothetical protein